STPTPLQQIPSPPHHQLNFASLRSELAPLQLRSAPAPLHSAPAPAPPLPPVIAQQAPLQQVPPSVPP
ncbi:hypothetical protein C0992_010351, partial [Termitomyces sp. T32_za158]